MKTVRRSFAEEVAFMLDEKDSVIWRVVGKSLISFLRHSVRKSPDALKGG